MATKKTEKTPAKKAEPKAPKAAKAAKTAETKSPRHPHGRVVARHESKEALAKALAPSLARPDEDTGVIADRLRTASNSQLLRLQHVVETVKEKFGDRAKLIAKLGAAGQKSKDKDYLAKLDSYSLPQLLESQRRTSGVRAPRLALVACVVASCYRDAATDNPSNHADGLPCGDALAYLPVDSEIVFSFDLARMRSSPLWSRFEPQIAHEMRSELEKFRAACGFDPTQTVQRVAFGIKNIKHDPVGVFVVHGVDTKRMLACAADQFGKHGETQTDRGVVIIDARDHDASAWTVVGDDTLVVELGAAANHDSITAVLASGSPLRSSPTFMGLYDHLEHGASIWAVVNGATTALDFFEDVRPRTIDGTITTTDRVTVAGRVKMATPEHAAKLAEMMNKDFLRGAPFLTRHDAVVSGSTIKVDVVLTADQLDTLLHEVGIH